MSTRWTLEPSSAIPCETTLYQTQYTTLNRTLILDTHSSTSLCAGPAPRHGSSQLRLHLPGGLRGKVRRQSVHASLTWPCPGPGPWEEEEPLGVLRYCRGEARAPDWEQPCNLPLSAPPPVVQGSRLQQAPVVVHLQHGPSPHQPKL